MILHDFYMIVIVIIIIIIIIINILVIIILELRPSFSNVHFLGKINVFSGIYMILCVFHGILYGFHIIFFGFPYDVTRFLICFWEDTN